MAQAADVSFNTTIEATLTPQRFVTSTPFKVPVARATKKGKGKQKNFVRPVCDICEECGKEYRCHRSFIKHKRTHAIQEAASKYPNLIQVLNHCMSTSKATIENVLVQSPVSSSKGQRYKTFLTSLLDDNVALHADWSEAMTKIHFAVTKSLENSKLLMPSALVNILLQNADELLSDVPLRTDLCALIEVCIPGEICEKSLIDIFIADYAFGLVKSILKYYADSLKEGCQSEPEREDVELTDEDKEVVHYVGGAVLRAFHRRSKQFPNSAGWKNIGRAISEKLLESDFVPGPPACVKAWTAAQDRGGLFNISGALFIFFSGVVQILKRTTEVTRINHEKVIEEVCSGAVLLLWDEALGDALSENQSYSLMCGFVRSFSNTYGRGHAKKLINEYKTKGEASVPLRHNVAPRN